jgi:hypothetical protein
MATLQPIAAESTRSYYLALLADAYGKEGQNEEGLTALTEALALVNKTGVHYYRFLTKQGHRDEARTMLAETHGWFTEGFDTADLKEAKALLGQLRTEGA